jgi:WD40 repeat protein
MPMPSPRPQSETLPLTEPVPDMPSEAATLAPADSPASGPEPGGFPTVPGYEILRELGRGGMGVVYQARQTKLGRVVALKMILSGAHAGPDDLARFRTEAEAIARLQHPNIVQVFEVGEHGGLPFFSLEFCPGGSLEKKLNGTPLPPREAAKLVEELARAMHAAHRENVVHRDLKPANVLLAADGTPKITDFGLAKKLDEDGRTQSGAIMGTPSYMAPEQAGYKPDAQARGIGPAADVYALGAILYECLTGRPPFKAAAPLDTILQVVSDEPVPPTQLQSKTPRDLETICLKCLQKEPRRRYATAEALADDLRRWQTGEPIVARPVGRVERLAKWVKRKPAVAALVGVSVLAAASLLAGGAFFTARLADEVKRAEGAEKAAKDEAAAAVAARNDADREKTNAQIERDQAKYQALRAEHARHAIQLDLALIAWERNDVAEAERVLGLVDEPFQQTWEQRYVLGLCRRKVKPLLRHVGLRVALSADGRRLVSSGDGDKAVRVWDAVTGKEELALTGGADSVQAVAISADGRRVAWGDRSDGTVRVWDRATGQEQRFLKERGGNVRSVAFSPDGQRIVAGSANGSVRVCDAATGEEKPAFKGHVTRVSGGIPVSSVAFSPDGPRIVSGSWDMTARVWDAATGQEKHVLKGHEHMVASVAFSPDGRRIVSGSWDKTVRMWDAATGEEKLTLKGHTGSIRTVAFSADGQLIVSGADDGTARVWAAATGEEKLTLKGHTGGVNSVALSPDGWRIFIGGYDGTVRAYEGIVRVWDLAAGPAAVALEGHTGQVTGLAIGDDGRRIARVTFDGTVRVWDAGTGREKLLFKFKEGSLSVIRVTVSADGRLVVGSGDDPTVRVWDAATGQEKFALKGHTGRVYAVEFSADGKRIISGGQDGTVRVWDAATGQEEQTLKGHTAPVSGVVISADGRRIVSGDGEGTVRVWDAAAGQERAFLEGYTKRGYWVLALSPDGQRVVARSDGGMVRVWDAATGEEQVTLKGLIGTVRGPKGGLTGTVRSAAFSPDGKRIVSGSEDGTVGVWDAATGEEKAVLQGHTKGVSGVAFSPDGQRVVSWGEDGTVRVWDAATGQEKLTLKERTNGVGVVISADGQRILSWDRNGTVRVWEAPPTAEKAKEQAPAPNR